MFSDEVAAFGVGDGRVVWFRDVAAVFLCEGAYTVVFAADPVFAVVFDSEPRSRFNYLTSRLTRARMAS